MCKIASIIGKPGMCRDDGSAIHYFYQVYTNNIGGAGFYEEGPIFSGIAAAYDAIAWAMHHGYIVTDHHNT